MKTIKARKIILVSCLCAILTVILSITAFAKTTVTDVSSSSQLEKALKKEAQVIRVVKSFTLDRTFYVTGNATIYADKAVTLTRKADFAGDIFVVGENAKGESALLDGNYVVFALGKKSGKKGSMLTIDGNRDNMKVQVNGSLIFNTNSSSVNIYSNVTLKNAYKVGNDRALNSRYQLPSRDRIGGPVAVNASGTINIHGGVFTNNGVNEEKISKDQNKSVYTSSCGGVFFNNSNININAGTFDKNTAANGGVVYNAYTLKITKGVFTSNKATTNGGVIYQSSSPTASTTIGADGSEKSEKALFKGNTATKDGGAIYSYIKGNMMIFGDAAFFSNKASDNGGAIAAYGALIAKNATFSKNTASDMGGAVLVATYDKELKARVCSFTNCDFTSNNSVQGGAVAVSAKTTSLKVGGKADFKNCRFTSNKAKSKKKPESTYGGAIYLSRKATLTVDDSSFSKNTAMAQGGAVYITGSSKATVTDSSFTSNSTTSKAAPCGAVSAKSSTLVLDVVTFKSNKSKGSAGAVGTYDCSSVILNKIKATGNSAGSAGGFLCNSGSTVKVYSSTLESNSSAGSGGAVAIYNKGATSIYKSKFISNKAGAHGGGVHVYSGDSESLIQSCTFSKNSATENGGAVFIKNSKALKMYNNTATANKAAKGGVIYITSSKPVVTVNGLKVSKNSAEKGSIIYGNNSKAQLKINKNKHTDSDTDKKLTSSYWKKAISGKIKVSAEEGKIPSYSLYKRNKTAKVKVNKHPSADTILNLGIKADNGEINEKYASLPKLDNSSNFMSRETTKFKNINKKTVTVDTFVYRRGEKAHNCSVGEGLLIYQAMLYKQAHPEEDVSIDFSTYRYSVQAAVNINRDSRYFGYMRNLVGKDYDKYGFVRISYLLVTAARMGIKVNVIGQVNGYPTSKKDPKFEEYFTSKLNDACDKNYVKDGVVGDYLNAVYCKWTLGVDNGSTDMMHVKVCAVSHYLDMNGKVHKDAVWSSSTNLDGIASSAKNGNSKLQTATIVSDHAKIYQVSTNYIKLMLKYGTAQDDIFEFRNIVWERNKEQINLILSGKESKIPKNEQIVYLGSDSDKVFEFYYAPLAGSTNVWNEKYNPYCKYIRKMYNSEDYVIITWNNARHTDSFALSKQINNLITTKLHKDPSVKNKIFVNLDGFSSKLVEDLVVGESIGYKSINQKPYGAIHNKDLQLSYVENGTRHYVSILNSINFHAGALCYQTNNILVIKEKNMKPGSVFHTVAKYSTTGIV